MLPHGCRFLSRVNFGPPGKRKSRTTPGLPERTCDPLRSAALPVLIFHVVVFALSTLFLPALLTTLLPTLLPTLTALTLLSWLAALLSRLALLSLLSLLRVLLLVLHVICHEQFSLLLCPLRCT